MDTCAMASETSDVFYIRNVTINGYWIEYAMGGMVSVIKYIATYIAPHV